jgi:hypothetical protein
LDEVRRFVFQIDFDELIGNILFGQDNPCPVSIGSGVAGIEFHEVPSLSTLNITGAL